MPKRNRDDEESIQTYNTSHTIICDYPPCVGSTFTDYLQYEQHIQSFHDYECESCQKNFPNNQILQLHINEHHDPFMDIKRERGESIYQCFCEKCSQKFVDVSTRNQHLIQQHNYPKEYPFDIVNTGIYIKT